MHVICPLSVVPVRKEPSDRAEMVTQWLFGETAEVLERAEPRPGAKWSRLRFTHDGYEGWVDDKQWRTIDAPEAGHPVRTIDDTTFVDLDGHIVRLPVGAVLPGFREGQIAWQDRRVKATAITNQNLPEQRPELLEMFMHAYLGAPYLWGGRTPWGIDCSGLTQMVFLLMGLPLQRDAWQQASQGEPVELMDLARTGDVAFFDNAEGRIVHVGIILRQPGENRLRIAHAAGRVRIDTLDQQGIHNADEKRYTHQLRLVRRMC